MRTLLFLLPFVLVACGSETDAPPADGDTATADVPAADGAVDPDLVGFWTQRYTQYESLDADPVTFSTNVYWTLNDDGTAFEAKQSEALGPDPLTENLTWSRSGDRLGFNNAATGDERHQWDVVRLEGDTLTVQSVARGEYVTLSRGEVNE